MVILHDHSPPASKGESPRVYPVCLATSYPMMLVVRDTSLLTHGLNTMHVTPYRGLVYKLGK